MVEVVSDCKTVLADFLEAVIMEAKPMFNNRIGWVRGWLVAMAIAVFWAVAGYIRYQPPTPLPSTVAADTFSAERAEPILEMLVGDGIPHPSLVSSALLPVVASLGTGRR